MNMNNASDYERDEKEDTTSAKNTEEKCEKGLDVSPNGDNHYDAEAHMKAVLEQKDMEFRSRTNKDRVVPGKHKRLGE